MMHLKALRLFSSLLLGLILGSSCLIAAEEPVPASLYIGSAKADITPPVGTPLAGYGKRHGKPSTGIHDPLYARAVALTHGDQTFVFVSTDLVLIDEGLRNEVLKKIRVKTPLRDEQLLLFATHTHSGSGAFGSRMWEQFIMGKKRKSVFDLISSGIAQVALEALNQKILVSAEYGETRIDALIENRMDEKKAGPHFLRILRFKSATGHIPASLLFMAAHPTLLPASNFEISADFPGVITEALEKEFPGSVNLFVNGAAGDLRVKMPPSPQPSPFKGEGRVRENDRFQKMQAYGFQLAEEAKKIEFHAVSMDGIWKSEIRNEKLPRVKIQAGFLGIPSLLGSPLFPRHSTLQVLRMGKFLFMTFPGELSSDIGRDLERQAKAFYFEPFLVGYAQDYIGYVIPRFYYQDTHQYESRASFYGSKMDRWVESHFRSLIMDLLNPEEKKIVEQPGKITYQEGIPVLQLTGDAYHVGFEEGRLLEKDIREGIDEIFAYFRKEVPVPGVNRLLMNVVADRAWKQMEPYISYEEYLQIKGIADGSGVSLKRIKQIHALPEIYPALCANSAFWGKATADGRMIAIRNLDWNRKMGIQRHAAVKWISIPGQHAYVNIGYAGFSGVLSGMNDLGISTGQIGATSSDETMKGTPMPFMLRRVLAQSSSLEDIQKQFVETPLTRGYNYVFADALQKKALVIEATAHHLAFFSDNDPTEKTVSYAESLENAVFRGDPALDPTIRDLQTASGGKPNQKGLEFPKGSAYEIRYKKQCALIRENYGQLTPETAQTIAREIAPGSNIQSVVYAYPEFFVANARDDKKAAESGYVRFNFEELSNQRR